jgi:signal transduction histidine kinase
VAAVAFAVATVVGPLRPGPQSAYAQLSPVLAMLDVAAGASLLLVGSLAWAWGRRGIGALALLASACWFGLDWAGDPGMPAAARMTGFVAGALTLPVLVHLVLRAVRANRRPTVRLVLGAVYVATAALAVAQAAVYVPKLDLRCFALCDLGPVTSLGNHWLARDLARAQDVVTAIVAASLAVWADLSLGRPEMPARKDRMAIIVSALLVGLAWTAWAIASLQPAAVTPAKEPPMTWLFAFQAFSAVTLAFAVGWSLSVEHRMLLAVQGIARQLSGLPGASSLQPALATALGDPGLRLAFPLPDGSGLVSNDGRVLPQPVGRTVEIEHGGQVAALIVPSRPSADDGAVRNLGAAVRLAAENERLLAVVRHELLELRASRARIVQTGDAARERLERDLHDGAQQRMLGIVYALAISRDRARASGDEAAASRLSEALDRADGAIEALRRIGRGIHDPVLTEAGLRDALESLAARAPIPVELVVDGDVSCAPESEVTAWRVAAHTIRLAAGAAATNISARVSRSQGELRLAMEVSGAERRMDLVSIDDRVGSGGGELEVATESPTAFAFQVRLPCG